MTASPVSMNELKQGLRAVWMAGDFGKLAKMTAPSAEAFVAGLQIGPGMNVLDVACGTGNLALPAARAGATVTGLDIAPNLLEQARARAAQEGLQIRFDEGDAEAMPYADASFDVVMSMFGAMFAPRPEVVAVELARVLKPGGTLAMANWNPASFTGRMFRVSAQHLPPPAGVKPPVLWGDEETVRERLEPHFHQIGATIVPIDFDFDLSPAGTVEFFRTYFGPTQSAFSRLDPPGQEALRKDLVDLWASANIAPDPAQRTLIRNEYLRVVATRK